MAYTFSFEKLEVWHLSIDLGEQIYQLTANFPDREKFGLVSQMRRAAVSVSSNLAEGSARTSPVEQARFYQIAYSSLMEVTSQLYFSRRIGFLEEMDLERLKPQILELSNKINSLRKSRLRQAKEAGMPYNDELAEDLEALSTEELEAYLAPTNQHPPSPEATADKANQQINKSTNQPLNKSTHQLIEQDNYFHHPTATIDPGAQIGPNTRIWHYSHVMSGAEIGADCSLGQNVFVAGGVKIGRGVKVQNNVSLYEGVSCEDEVFIGPSAVFTNVFNPRSSVVRKAEYRPTKVGRGASIGANATIICGLTIGAYAFVAAGATVTRDVPPYALVRGVPARQTGWMSEHGCKLTFDGAEDTVCEESGEVYELVDKRIRKVR